MNSSEELSIEEVGKSPVREKSISNHRVHHNIQQFLVHWQGKNPSTKKPYEPTWKPEANIQNKQIVLEYKVSIGIMAAPTKLKSSRAHLAKSMKPKSMQKQHVKIKSESPEKRTIKEVVPLETPPTSEEDVPSIRMSNSPRSVADSRRSSRGRSSTGRLSIEPRSKPPSVKASPVNKKKRKVHVLSDSDDARTSPRARKIKRIPESSQSASQRSLVPEEPAEPEQANVRENSAERIDRTDAFARPPPDLRPVASTSKVKSPTKSLPPGKAIKSTGKGTSSPESKTKRKKARDWLVLGKEKEDRRQSFPTPADFNEEQVIPDSQQEASLVSRYTSSGESRAPNLKPVPQPTARLLHSLQAPLPHSSPIEDASSQIDSSLLPSVLDYETAPQSPLAQITSPPESPHETRPALVADGTSEFQTKMAHLNKVLGPDWRDNPSVNVLENESEDVEAGKDRARQPSANHAAEEALPKETGDFLQELEDSHGYPPKSALPQQDDFDLWSLANQKDAPHAAAEEAVQANGSANPTEDEDLPNGASVNEDIEQDDDSLPPPLDLDKSYKKHSSPALNSTREQEKDQERLTSQDKTQAHRWVEDDQSESTRLGVLELLEGAVKEEVKSFFADPVAYRDGLVPSEWETMCFHLADVDDEQLVLVISIQEARYRITLVPFGQEASYEPEMQHVQDWAEQQDGQLELQEPENEVAADDEEQMRIQAEEQLQMEEESRHKMAEAELLRLEQEEQQAIVEAEYYDSQIRLPSVSEDPQRQSEDQLEQSSNEEQQEEDQTPVRSSSQEVEEPDELVNGVSSPVEEPLDDQLEDQLRSKSPARSVQAQEEDQVVNGVSSPPESVHSPKAIADPLEETAAPSSPMQEEESEISAIAESFRFSQPEHLASQIPTTVPAWIPPAEDDHIHQASPAVEYIEEEEYEEPAQVHQIELDQDEVPTDSPPIEADLQPERSVSPPEWTGFDDPAQIDELQSHSPPPDSEADLAEEPNVNALEEPVSADVDQPAETTSHNLQPESPKTNDTSMRDRSFEILREKDPSQTSSVDKPSLNAYSDYFSFSQNGPSVEEPNAMQDTRSIYPDLATFGDMLADEMGHTESRSINTFPLSAEASHQPISTTFEEAMLRPDDAATTLTGPLTTMEEGYSDLLQSRLDQLHREQEAASTEAPATNGTPSPSRPQQAVSDLPAMQDILEENTALRDQVAKLSRDNDALRSSRRYAEDEAGKYRQAYAEASTAASIRGVEVVELEARVIQLERQLDEGLRQRDLVSKAREKKAADELNKLRIQHDLLKTNFRASDISMLRRQAALGIESAGIAADLRAKLARQEASASNWQQSLASGGAVAAQSDSDDESFSGSGVSSSSNDEDNQEMSYQATPAQAVSQVPASKPLCRWRQSDGTWCAEKTQDNGGMMYHLLAHSDLL